MTEATCNNLPLLLVPKLRITPSLPRQRLPCQFAGMQDELRQFRVSRAAQGGLQSCNRAEMRLFQPVFETFEIGRSGFFQRGKAWETGALSHLVLKTVMALAREAGSLGRSGLHCLPDLCCPLAPYSGRPHEHIRTLRFCPPQPHLPSKGRGRVQTLLHS